MFSRCSHRCVYDPRIPLVLILFFSPRNCTYLFSLVYFAAQVPNRLLTHVDACSPPKFMTAPENGPIPSNARSPRSANQNSVSGENWTLNKNGSSETNLTTTLKPVIALTNGPSSNSGPGDFKLMCNAVVRLDRLGREHVQSNDNRARGKASSLSKQPDDDSGSGSEDGSPTNKIFRAKGKEREESKRKGIIADMWTQFDS